jgi:hypothetical protein
MKNENQNPTLKEVEKNGLAVMGYSVNDSGKISFTDYTGDLTEYEYLGEEYKIVKWNKNSKNKGKQFIND